MAITPINVGIDYSMTCPAMCVHVGEIWNVKNCNFYWLTGRKAYVGIFNDILFGQLLNDKIENQEERFDKLSDYFVDILNKLPIKPQEIGIEGYSMGSKGKVFGIAENTGLLKHKLYKAKYTVLSYAPKSVKKFGSGNGNADKDFMYNAFSTETGLDLRSLLCYDSTKIGSPIGDIVDSYYICKYNFYSGVLPK